MYSAWSLPGFGGGLNLRDRPAAVDPSEAIDCLNVVFTETGAVRQRDGYDNYTSSALTNTVESLEPYYTTAGTAHLIAGCGTRLEAITAAGSVTSSTGFTSGGIWDFARFGTPNAERMYAGNGIETIQRWDGSSWTSGAASATVDGVAAQAMPKAGLLCVQPTDNRLVATGFTTTSGGPGGAASSSSPSHVYFSAAGDPETWSTTDYVQLTPGDGEKITAALAWREFTFVFKESKFFVFHGNSVDSGGDPVFNYYPVDAATGTFGPRSVVAGTDGVYFADRTGIYRTQGQEPERISDPVLPIFDANSNPSDFYGGGTLLQTKVSNTALGWHNERLYVAFTITGTTNSRTLVYDPAMNWWSLWDLAASCFAVFRFSSVPELVFGYATGSKHVGRHSDSYTTDDGTAITSRWRGGWYDLENTTNKTVREAKFWGTGKVYVGIGGDYELATGTLTYLDFTDPATATWGGTTWGGSTWASPAQLVPQLYRNSVRGTAFSTSFYNNVSGQAWSVHRGSYHLRIPRQPSVLQTEVSI